MLMEITFLNKIKVKQCVNANDDGCTWYSVFVRA